MFLFKIIQNYFSRVFFEKKIKSKFDKKQVKNLKILIKILKNIENCHDFNFEFC